MATAFIIYLSVILILFYAIGVVFFLRLNKETNSLPNKELTPVFPVSVVVAYRNEAKNLPLLIKSFNQLQFNGDFEVLFVNDHSEDNGTDLLIENELNFPHSLLTLSGNQFGKKLAVAKGISKAKYPIVVITDADCTFSPQWLNSLVTQFNDDSVGLVTGGVQLAYTSTFQKWQMLEQTVLSAAVNLSFSSDTPWMVNGANLAIRKSYLTLADVFKDNLDLASGDDEYILKNILKNGGKLVFNSALDAKVKTLACLNLESLLSQRHRWASKISRSGIMAKVISLLFVLLHLWPLLLFILGLFKPTVLAVFFLFVVLRFWSDKFLFKSLLSDPTDQPTLAELIVAEFWQHVYVPIVSWRVLFYNYTWKGRSSDEFRSRTS